ncbi:hypothetical protein [Mucilaginibacter myungsuensis]|uniref:Uncharacterized protein n=1 Tax=Mucilaginibacter myungsuensis TaxID=649104 RepID=A0A929KSX1_9SPHI|nr:hypothetical protein [Mucilaginibacter myungsuensis]MBE9660567.1 hypothetical protein [Mucilaginibacter myungsuensis]MDN3600611.1 hypothetical protein [Mucilaginibacter myungsuensis]
MDITTSAVNQLITSKNKINNLLAKQIITLPDIAHLSQAEKNHMSEVLTERLDQLKDEVRDRYLSKIDPILTAGTRHAVWEYNHMVISEAISKFIQKYGVMPKRGAIADETGLSRQTIAKHFNGYAQHPMFDAEMEQFKFMSNSVLSTVFKLANNGDMRAAKLYFEMIGTLNKQQPATVVNEQNNYIQINNTILSQQNLKSLSAEQLDMIEGIIKGEKSKVLGLEA